MNLYKFDCPQCNQSMETETKPDVVVECPTCNFSFAPVGCKNLSYYGLDDRPSAVASSVLHPALVAAADRQEAKAAEAESDSNRLRSICVVLIVLGAVAAALVGSAHGAVAGIIAFSGILWIAVALAILSRLAAIHAAILRK